MLRIAPQRDRARDAIVPRHPSGAHEVCVSKGARSPCFETLVLRDAFLRNAPQHDTSQECVACVILRSTRSVRLEGRSLLMLRE